MKTRTRLLGSFLALSLTLTAADQAKTNMIRNRRPPNFAEFTLRRKSNAAAFELKKSELDTGKDLARRGNGVAI